MRQFPFTLVVNEARLELLDLLCQQVEVLPGRQPDYPKAVGQGTDYIKRLLPD